MTFSEMFGTAKFVGTGSDRGFCVLRSQFTLKKAGKATIRLLGLGFFHCYINGVPVSEDRFLPLATDYEKRDDYPIDEELTGHRVYVPEYDISHLVRAGENTVAISFGGGWYNLYCYFYRDPCRYGDPKAIYRVMSEEGEFVSSAKDKILPSYISDYEFHTHEFQDYRGFDPAVFGAEYDDSTAPFAKELSPLETDYLISECPADRVAERITPALVGEQGGVRTYDAGKNLSGVPVLRLDADGEVKVVFSEEIRDGMPDPAHQFKQEYRVCGRAGQTVSPDFTWFGFRYFSVEGAATPVEVDFIHTDVAVNSDFACDDELLNWIYRTSIHTELCNFHGGIPSDCPHIERQGYTGDGELTARAMMTVADTQAFYKKWIGDIMDCQDVKTGHIQYTAPYFRSGGGPGAWGCAIVEVPYQYYKMYGDDSLARAAYPQMKKYFDYLEDHSVGGFIVSDKKGEWCLGDWCTQQKVALPAPFVNNYYYVRSMMRAIELAEHFGYAEDIPEFERRIAERKAVLKNAYFNTWDSNFFGCIQGANAFMADIGVGNEDTYRHLVDHYTKTGELDTGICGIEVLTRVLFEHGDGELAVKLLSPETPVAFRGWYEAGATTLWEYFCNSTRVRSHNHPMFGSVITNFFRFLLGIGDASEAGYRALRIAPFLPEKLNFVRGYQTIPAGKVSVEVTRTACGVRIETDIPEGVPATLVYGEKTYTLTPGKNLFDL